MSDYIRRQDALDAFNRIKNTLKNPKTAHYDTLMFYEIEDVLEDVEPADVVQVVHGRWIKVGVWGRVYRCDQCGNFLDFDGVNAGRGDANFCPNCGADMRGEQNDESRSKSNAQTDTKARGMGTTDKSSGI